MKIIIISILCSLLFANEKAELSIENINSFQELEMEQETENQDFCLIEETDRVEWNDIELNSAEDHFCRNKAYCKAKGLLGSGKWICSPAGAGMKSKCFKC